MIAEGTTDGLGIGRYSPYKWGNRAIPLPRRLINPHAPSNTGIVGVPIFNPFAINAVPPPTKPLASSIVSRLADVCAGLREEDLLCPLSASALQQLDELAQRCLSSNPVAQQIAKATVERLSSQAQTLVSSFMDNHRRMARTSSARTTTPPLAAELQGCNNPDIFANAGARQILTSKLPEAVQDFAYLLYCHTYYRDGSDDGRMGERYEYAGYLIELPDEHFIGIPDRIACSKETDGVSQESTLLTDFLDRALEKIREEYLTSLTIHFGHSHPEDMYFRVHIHEDGRYYTKLSYKSYTDGRGDFTAHHSLFKRAVAYLRKAGYTGRVEFFFHAIPVPLQPLDKTSFIEKTYIASYHGVEEAILPTST